MRGKINSHSRASARSISACSAVTYSGAAVAKLEGVRESSGVGLSGLVSERQLNSKSNSDPVARAWISESAMSQY